MKKSYKPSISITVPDHLLSRIDALAIEKYPYGQDKGNKTGRVREGHVVALGAHCMIGYGQILTCPNKSEKINIYCIGGRVFLLN